MNTLEISTIENLENQLLNAMLEANVEILDKLIHPDLLFNSAMGQTLTKEMDLDSYHKDLIRIESITPSDQQINIIGDTATVTVTINMVGTFGTVDISGKVRFLRVWKNFDSHIQIIAGSSIMLQ